MGEPQNSLLMGEPQKLHLVGIKYRAEQTGLYWNKEQAGPSHKVQVFIQSDSSHNFYFFIFHYFCLSCDSKYEKQKCQNAMTKAWPTLLNCVDVRYASYVV